MHEEQLTEQLAENLTEGQLLLIGGSWWSVSQIDRLDRLHSTSLVMNPAIFGRAEDNDPKSNPSNNPCIVTFRWGTKVLAS